MKTFLIIGGAAVGVYVLLKVLGPAKTTVPAAAARQPSPWDVLGSAGIGAAASGIASLFKSSPSPSYAGETPEQIRANDPGVAQYDALGTKSAPVYGIAGIDY